MGGGCLAFNHLHGLGRQARCLLPKFLRSHNESKKLSARVLVFVVKRGGGVKDGLWLFSVVEEKEEEMGFEN